MYRTVEVFRRAFAAIIDFATSQNKSVFSPSEVADIKEIMYSYSNEDSEQQKSVGKWLVGHAGILEQLASNELIHTHNEVDDIIEDTYNWKIELDKKISKKYL